MLHKCYNGLILPSFAKPLDNNQVGTKLMAQSRTAKLLLCGKKLNSFHRFPDSFWVWMNLWSSDEQKIVPAPVRLMDDLPNDIITDFSIDRGINKRQLR